MKRPILHATKYPTPALVPLAGMPPKYARAHVNAVRWHIMAGDTHIALCGADLTKSCLRTHYPGRVCVACLAVEKGEEGVRP